MVPFVYSWFQFVSWKASRDFFTSLVLLRLCFQRILFKVAEAKVEKYFHMVEAVDGASYLNLVACCSINCKC